MTTVTNPLPSVYRLDCNKDELMLMHALVCVASIDAVVAVTVAAGNKRPEQTRAWLELGSKLMLIQAVKKLSNDDLVELKNRMLALVVAARAER